MLFRRKRQLTEAEREAKARADERQAAMERLRRAAEEDAKWVREGDRGNDRPGPSDHHR